MSIHDIFDDMKWKREVKKKKDFTRDQHRKVIMTDPHSGRHFKQDDPLSEIFINSLRDGKTQKERKELFFERLEAEFQSVLCWTQKEFIEHERDYRAWIQDNPDLSDSELREKYCEKLVDWYFHLYRDAWESRQRHKEFMSEMDKLKMGPSFIGWLKGNAVGLVIVLAISGFFVKCAIDPREPEWICTPDGLYIDGKLQNDDLSYRTCFDGTVNRK